jgi:8-oxo-dGTP pyrophosphatase MutT (NUDIX family)
MSAALDEVRAALAAWPWRELPPAPGRTNHLRAGVAVPVQVHDGRLHVVLTLRPHALPRHADEICFPGGRPDAGDTDLHATALRECREELGVEPTQTLGRLSSTPIYTSDWRLDPWVVGLDDTPLAPDAREVARVLRWDLTSVVEGAPLEGLTVDRDGRTQVFPIMRLEGLVCYGATAFVLHELANALATLRGRPLPRVVVGDLDWRLLMDHRAWAADPTRRPADGAQRDR